VSPFTDLAERAWPARRNLFHSPRRTSSRASFAYEIRWKVSYVGPGIMRRSKPSVLLAEPVAVNR
jgi:hypothetical protein